MVSPSSTNKENQDHVPIAVIGMALRAPQADTPEIFWDNLLSERDCFTRPTEKQLRRAGVPDRLIHDPDFIRARLLLCKTGDFDAVILPFDERADG